MSNNNENSSIPLVSISCITYNHAKYIRDAIEGFLMQKTNFKFEILIHDDASTDGTYDIIKRYELKYPSVIFPIYQKKNQYSQGVMISPTYNWPRARGKYIALCEGDDYWTDPMKLQKQVDFMEANPDYALCFHDTYVKKEDQLIAWRTYEKEVFSILDTFSTRALLHTSSILFRRDTYYCPNWLSKVVSGDMALISIVANEGKLKRIPEFMSVYRKHKGGITETAHIIDNFHENRIKLMSFLNKEFNYKYNEEISDVISFHRNCLKQKPTCFKKIRHKLRSEHVLNTSLMDNFTKISFTSKNIDTYYIRSSILASLEKVLPTFEGELLDIGCGKMPYKKYILENSAVTNYLGLDIENALEYDSGIKPDYVWDGEIMPFEENRFNCAFATEVLEHCPNPEVTLKEIFRVLKPGGVLFFTVPFLWNLHEVPHDEYRYTPFALERHLKNSGFSSITVNATGGWHASLAQMLGLWVQRSNISKRKRKIISIILKPVISYLIKHDKIPVSFDDGPMITGLSGTAYK